VHPQIVEQHKAELDTILSGDRQRGVEIVEQMLSGSAERPVSVPMDSRSPVGEHEPARHLGTR
jgi:hypothetical protein